MVTTKFYLDVRATKTGQPAPLKIAITKKGSTTYLPLNVTLLPTQWDQSKQKVKEHPRKQFLNSYISKRKVEIDEIVLSMIANKETDGTVTEIKKRILAIIAPPEEERADNIFCDWLERFANTKSGRTKAIYLATFERIKKYLPKTFDKVTFEDMNVAWLDDFDTFLSRTSPARNARNIHFRNIRAIFNYAIDHEVTSAYPFRKFKMKNEPTRKRSLTAEVMKKVLTAPVSPYLEKYRDFFALSFYFVGMNVVDICNATVIADGRIEYDRAKTHKHYSIRVEPEAASIIEKYRGVGQLLCYLDTHKNYRSFYNCLCRGLNSIKDELNDIDDGLEIKELTTYWARHTWATIARKIGISRDDIALSLGHGLKSVTDIYIDEDLQKVDDANRRVIDYVLYGKVSP